MASTTLADGERLQTQEAPAYISWPAVFAGNAVTGGLILVMLPLGAAAGLAMTSAYTGQGASASTVGMAAVLWLAFMYLVSISAGGYIVGRLRPRVGERDAEEITFRDSMNGLVFWGVGMIVSALFTFWTVTSAVSTVTTAAGSAAGGVASAIGQSLPVPDAKAIADVLLRPNATPSATTTARTDEDVRSEVGRIVTGTVISGEMSDADKQYLVTVVAQRTALPESEVKARVDQAAQRAIELKAQAQATAEAARKQSSRAAFWTAIISLFSGIIAAYAAGLGGKHRDDRRF